MPHMSEQSLHLFGHGVEVFSIQKIVAQGPPQSYKSDTARHSFFPDVTRMWNALPSDMVTAGSLDVFKKRQGF